MIHHFGDLLNREKNYWKIIPNGERYAYLLPENLENKNDIKIITITSEMTHWQDVFLLKNLEEITLHQPNKEQILELSKLNHIKRLRITNIRLKDIEFISQLTELEELILEYVSGFSDLSPLTSCQKLKSIHLECLRKVSDFSPLGEIKNLRYLAIFGSLDWNQVIDNFEFLKNLSNLEYLRATWCNPKAPTPVFMSARRLKHLKYIHLSPNCFSLEDFAFLEVALPNADGIKYPLFKKIDSTNNLYFLGKGSRSIKEDAKNAPQKIAEFTQKYEDLKQKIKNDLNIL